MSVALVGVGVVAASPVVPLGIVAAALLAIVIVESSRPPDRRPAPAS